MQFSYTNNLSELGQLAADIERFCDSNNLPPDMGHAFNLCLDELVTNVINYGFQDSAPHELHLQLTDRGTEVVAILQDNGIAFNPLSDASAPNLEAALEDRDVGGLGVYFVKQMMDAIEYRRENGQNVLTLKKTKPK